MLRTLARTCVILVLAAVVGGALYLAVEAHGPSRSEERLAPRDVASLEGRFGHGRGQGDARTARREHRSGREEASVGHGLAGVVSTALQVACVGAVVVVLEKRRRRRDEGRTRG